MKTRLKLLLILFLVPLLFTSGASEAFAYFSLPGVSIAPSQSSISLTSGQTQTIGVQVSPLQESQLPGCGMAECPQICGPGCIDANGWCVCEGTTYSTYYTQVSAASSNNAVAQASWSNGALFVTGVSPGSATVTIRASLAKHVDSSISIAVTVAAAPAAGGTGGGSSNTGGGSPATNPSEGGSGSNSNGGGGSPSGGSSSANAQGNESSAERAASSAEIAELATGSSLASSGAAEGAEEDTVVKRTAQDGTSITLVTLGKGVDISEQLQEVAGKDERIIFQQKDGAGNVTFSLSFSGKEISSQKAKEFSGSLEGTLTTALPEGVSAQSDADTLMLHFDEHVELPALAEAYIAIKQHFGPSTSSSTSSSASAEQLTQSTAPEGAVDAEGDSAASKLTCYELRGEGNSLSKIGEGALASNGYVVVELETTNDLIVTNGELSVAAASTSASSGAGGEMGWLPFVLTVSCVVVVLAAFTLALMHRRKRKVLQGRAIDEEGSRWKAEATNSDEPMPNAHSSELCLEESIQLGACLKEDSRIDSEDSLQPETP